MLMMTRRFYQAYTRIMMAALFCGVLSGIPSRAQDAAPAPQEGGTAASMQARQLEMMTQRLNLTTDQQSQIKTIQDDSRKQMMALRNDSSLSQDQQRSKMMDIRKSSQDKIRGVLTEEQKTKYDAMQAEMRERMRNRQQGQAPPQ
jgi:Spy/CpxP family protein refolding chaperone